MDAGRAEEVPTDAAHVMVMVALAAQVVVVRAMVAAVSPVPTVHVPMVHEVAGEVMAKLAAPMAHRRPTGRRQADPGVMARVVVLVAVAGAEKPVPMAGRRVLAFHPSDSSSALMRTATAS